MKTVPMITGDLFFQLLEVLSVEDMLRLQKRCKKHGFNLLRELLGNEVEKRNEEGRD